MSAADQDTITGTWYRAEEIDPDTHLLTTIEVLPADNDTYLVNSATLHRLLTEAGYARDTP